MEAGASKNEEARASNNEYRCHYQRVEILKEHICEMLRAVAGEEPRCGGNHLFGIFSLEKLKKVIPPRAPEGPGRSPDAGESPFRHFQP